MPGYDINSNNNKLQEEGNHIVTYQSGPSKTENYCLVRNDQRKFVKDIKALPSEEFITRQNPLICDANK